jgi:hypothetical protein
MSGTSQKTEPLKVKRNEIGVVIFTQCHRIEGKVHTFPGSRITDFMNARTEQTFLAVTEARVYALSGERPLYTAGFLNVNRSHITLVMPQTKIEDKLWGGELVSKITRDRT